jgi:MFS family permease
VFYAGIIPALLLAFFRRGMVEPERFAAVRERRAALAAGTAHTEEDKEFLRFVPLQLFNRQNIYSTMVGLLFCVGTLLAIWTSVIWLPSIQRDILAGEGIKGNDAISYISFGMTMWSFGGILGYAAFGFIADALGRRPTILIYNVGTLVVGVFLYLAIGTYAPYPWILFLFGFFVFGVFSGHAVYLPELFPTHVRATAVSFCNGSGRIITSFGPLLAGLLVGIINLRYATAGMTCFALLSIVAMAMGRETRDDELPH